MSMGLGWPGQRVPVQHPVTGEQGPVGTSVSVWGQQCLPSHVCSTVAQKSLWLWVASRVVGTWAWFSLSLRGWKRGEEGQVL